MLQRRAVRWPATPTKATPQPRALAWAHCPPPPAPPRVHHSHPAAGPCERRLGDETAVMRAAGAKARLGPPVPQRQLPPPRCVPCPMNSPLALLRSHLSRGKRPAPSAHVTPAAPTCLAPPPGGPKPGVKPANWGRWTRCAAAPPWGAALQSRGYKAALQPRAMSTRARAGCVVGSAPAPSSPALCEHSAATLQPRRASCQPL